MGAAHSSEETKHLKRASVSEDVEEGEFDDEYNNYFQTLVTRGAPRGVLTVNVKSCRDFKSSLVKGGTHGFLRISVQGKVKCTRFQPYKDTNEKIFVVFDEWKYFSILIPKEGEHTLDRIHGLVILELIFKHDTGIPKLMGKAYIKLLDLLDRDINTMHVDLKLSHQVMCKLDIDMLITYGTFGYGYSHQVKHSKRTMDSFIDHSLFPRCPPPDERRDPHYNVMTPRPMPGMDIIGSLKRRETLGLGVKDDNCIFPPTLLDQLHRRGRLLHLYKRLEMYESEREAVDYLEKLIFKRGHQTASWRQNKANEGMSGRPTLREVLMDAARNAHRAHLPETQPDAATDPLTSPPPSSPLVSFSLEDELEPSTPYAPLFRLGEILASPWKQLISQLGISHNPASRKTPEESGITWETSAERERTERDRKKEAQMRYREAQGEAVVKGLDMLALSPEEPLSAPIVPQRPELPNTSTNTSSRDASLAASPGAVSLPGIGTSSRLGGVVQESPQRSSPQGFGSPSGKPEVRGVIRGQVEEFSSGLSAPGPPDLPRSHSPAQSVVAPVTHSPKLDSAPLDPSPSADSSQNHPLKAPLTHPSRNQVAMDSPASISEDPIESWLRAPSSIPSLSKVLSEKDLEPIRSSLAFNPPCSSSPPQSVTSISSLAEPGGRARATKPSRDKLKGLEGTSSPYRRPSLPR